MLKVDSQSYILFTYNVANKQLLANVLFDGELASTSGSKTFVQF